MQCYDSKNETKNFFQISLVIFSDSVDKSVCHGADWQVHVIIQRVVL